MRERPVLFSAPMVRSLLDGSKTQTRRVLKQAVGPSLSVGIEDESGVAELSWLHGDGPGHDVHETIKRVPCPYGAPGDRLWVRETWAHHVHAQSAQRADDGPFVYAADGVAALRMRLSSKWTPGIHMFRWASRITLEVTEVRVERLQAISEADALAEGIDDGWLVRNQVPPPRVLSYRRLWEDINGADSWNANPWVWVISFRRL